jgi:protein TonB
MRDITDTGFQRAGWSVSIGLHVSVLVLGSYFIFRPPQFGLAVAPTSTEVDLVEDVPPAPPLMPIPQAPLPTIVPPAPEISPPVTPKIDDLIVPKPVLPTSIIERKVKPAQAIQRRHRAPSSRTEHLKSGAYQGAESAAPDYLHNPPPVYPPESQQADEQGTVLLWVEVDAAGNPVALTLRQTSGHPRLDRAAMDAVRHWKFHPATLAGIAVESDVAVPVLFELH